MTAKIFFVAVTTGLLRRLEFGMVEDGTAIGMGISTALNRLRQSKSKSKVVILLTDGIQADQPDLVVEAIRQVVEGSRGAASTPASPPVVGTGTASFASTIRSWSHVPQHSRIECIESMGLPPSTVLTPTPAAAIGPILQKEISGWDTVYSAAREIYPSLSNTATVPRCLEERVLQGRHGMKTGEGFMK